MTILHKNGRPCIPGANLKLQKLAGYFPDSALSTALLPVDRLTCSQASRHRYKMLLTPEEKRTYSKLKLKKRRYEWLAGRICAKTAIRRHPATGHIPRTEITIRNAKNGRPSAFLNNQTTENIAPELPDISISHSRNLACAIAADALCGIDIQRQEERLLKVRNFYCSNAEYALLETTFGNDTLQGLTLLWSAKEAFRKTFSASFLAEFRNMRLTGFEGREDIFLFQISHPKVSVSVRIACTLLTAEEIYGIALCVRPHGTTQIT